MSDAVELKNQVRSIVIVNIGQRKSRAGNDQPTIPNTLNFAQRVSDRVSDRLTSGKTARSQQSPSLRNKSQLRTDAISRGFYEHAKWRSLRLCAAKRIEYSSRFQARMKIESFVSQALEQLGAGIEKVKDKPGIRISPIPYTDPSSNLAGGRLIDSQGNGAIIVFVQFDLSVVVTKHAAGEAKAGLEVLGLDFGGGKLEGGVDHTKVQRIKFEVPVSFPVI